MRNLAVIPARSGSKGLVHKNIKSLGGVPLMAYSIRAAQATDLFTHVMVSTDSKVYGEIAKEHGAEVPFLRSVEQSSDTADHSPLWCMTLQEDKSMDAFRENLKQTGPRQKLEKFYRLNGAVYIRRVRYNGDDIEILHTNEYALIMDAKRSVDIDTQIDFQMAELLIKHDV